MSKPTEGEWQLAENAQGPFAIMHPTRRGVAIAVMDNHFVPVNGFVSDPQEYIANTRLFFRARELKLALAAIIRDLPERRDWLDPDVEKMAREVLKELGE